MVYTKVWLDPGMKINCGVDRVDSACVLGYVITMGGVLFDGKDWIEWYKV